MKQGSCKIFSGPVRFSSGIRKEVLLQITKMIILILPSACGFVLSDVLVCSSSDLFTSVCCVLHC